MNKLNHYYNSIATSITRWSTKRFLVTIIVIQILLHLPVVSLPPMGQHVWRQVMGLSVARNYYEEGTSFLNSAQDIRIGKEDKGYIYTEFPLVYWLVGQSYHLTGFSHINGRVAALFFGILLIPGFYRLIRLFSYEEVKARWAVFFLSCSPLFFYYSISLLPNLPALCMFVWGINLILPSLRKEQWNLLFWLGVLLLIISTATKVLYLFYGIPIAYIFIKQYLTSKNIQILLVGFVSGISVLAANYFLYRHGINLMEQSPFERASTILLDFDTIPKDLMVLLSILRVSLNEWFLQMYVNTAAMPIFFVGIYWIIKNKAWKSEHGEFWVAWTAGFLVLCAFFFPHFEAHGYYLTSILGLAALGTSYGIGYLLNHPKAKWFAVFLVIMVPLVMVGRVGHRWIWAKQVPDELLYQSEAFEQVIPKEEQVLVFGDSSPVIFLYFLHRKGLSLGNNTSLDRMKLYHEKGFRYIVSDIPPDKIPVLSNIEHEQVGKIDNFYILKMEHSLAL